MASGWPGLDWGSVPTWVGTIVTSTSVAIAALSYRRSVADKEREQARHVASWVGLVEEDGKLRRILRITNGSEAPVYELTAWSPDSVEIRLTELPPKATTTADLGLVNDRRPSRDPQASIVSARIRFWFMEVEGTAVSETMSQEPAPELEFRDAVGRWWHRSADGRLKPIKERAFRLSEVRTRYLIPPLGSVEFKSSRRPPPQDNDEANGRRTISPPRAADEHGQPPESGDDNPGERLDS